MVFILNGLQLRIGIMLKMIYYCYTSMNIGREADVIVVWNEKMDSGMVFLNDNRKNKWKFICDFR